MNFIKNKNRNELTNFYLLQLGQFISQIGSKMTSFSLVLWLYAESGSVLSVSILSICSVLPSIVLSFIAGSISDKWDKKKIMLVSDSIAAMFSVLVLALLINDSLRIEHLYVINTILSITDAFQNPASEVAISLIVKKENYMKISGVRSFCNSFITIFTPMVATSIYAFGGLKTIIMVDFITFIIAYCTLAFLVAIPKYIVLEKYESIVLSSKQGIQYIINEKGILDLILFMWFINLIAAMYNNNLAPMVLSRNGYNEIQLGIVSASVGVAGFIGSLFVTKQSDKVKRIPRILNIMSFSFLVCNNMLGFGRNYYVWTLAVLLGNCCVPILIANVEYIMRTKIPIQMQGRVFSARNTLQYGSIPLGYALGGIIVDKILEPFMKHPSMLQNQLGNLVGEGKGSGIAVLYILLGMIGFLGCCIFRFNKELRQLDD